MSRQTREVDISVDVGTKREGNAPFLRFSESARTFDSRPSIGDASRGYHVNHGVLRGQHSPTRSVVSESDVGGNKGHWWQFAGLSFRHDEDEQQNFVVDAWYDTLAFWTKFMETCYKVPSVPFTAFLIFGALCGGSVAAVIWYYGRDQADRKEAAQAVAISLASALSAQIDLVLLPMFALAVDASTDPTLIRGPEIVASWPLDDSKDPTTHRHALDNNETRAYAQHFNKVAGGLLSLVTTSSAIMNVQMAPAGVVSWIHPMDQNQAAVGHDLLRDPARIPDAVKTIEAQQLVMAGPVQLIQGGTMMIGRLPIFVHKEAGQGVDTCTIPLIGREVKEDHLFWGFCVSLINFQTLLQETGFEDELANHQMRFNLTRTNRVLDDDGETVHETRKVVAASAAMEGTEEDDPANLVEGVEVEVEFHSEVMTLTVSCARGCEPDWKWWALTVCVAGSAALAAMVLVVLVLRAQHTLLLQKMLPRQAIRRINRGKQVIDEFQAVSIFFSDIVGFTSLAGKMSPIDVMRMLNDLYQEFDKLVDKHGVYKVETIGDAYMVTCGAPEPLSGPETAARVASFALDCLEAVKTLETSTGHHIQIRCGIHSGPVVAGVVGTAMPRYCFFGDTVNTASRMESTSTVGRLQVSAATCGFLQVWQHHNQQAKFRLYPRQNLGGQRGIEVKGKGVMDTWWVERNDMPAQQVAVTIRDSPSEAGQQRNSSPRNPPEVTPEAGAESGAESAHQEAIVSVSPAGMQMEVENPHA